ncbi:MAG: site-specific integrase [Eubacteriales bacterium]|nr:site-specific integrase [Eubacteriales bacterium]
MPKNKIHKRANGQYIYKVTGQKRYEISSRKGELLSEFKKRCNDLDKKAELSLLVPLGKQAKTLDDLVDLWMQEHVMVKLSPAEYRVMEPVYRLHVKPFLGRRRIESITRADVYRVLATAEQKGLSAPYIQKIRSCISRPYNWAINSLGYELTAPTQGLVYTVRSRNSAGRSRYIKQEEYFHFLESVKNTKYYNFYRILYATGLRPSEALALQSTDLEGSYLKIRRGITRDGLSELKTSASKREIPVNPKLKAILLEQAHIKTFETPQHWLFPMEDQQMPSMAAVESAFKRGLKQTAVYHRGGRNGMKKLDVLVPALNFSLYDFRHTFATNMVAAGMSATMLQAIMGHTEITTTLKYYTEVTEEMENEAKLLMEAILKEA